MLFHFIMILCLFTFPSIMALGTLQGSNLNAMNNIAKPACQTHCGNITVPYPFGISNGTRCSLDESFYLTCNSTHYDPPKLFIRSTNIEIYNISESESELRIFTSISYRCYNRNGTVRDVGSGTVDLPELFTFSGKNMLTVIGCDDIAIVMDDDFYLACLGICMKEPKVSDGQCPGIGCCQLYITNGLPFFNISIKDISNHGDVWEFNPCGYAFLAEEHSFDYRGASDLSDGLNFVKRTESTVPVVLDWVIARNRSCSKATECKENSSCYNVDGGGYRCRCNQGYKGNPYLDQGCKDINECDDRETYPCDGTCINTVGSYNCYVLNLYSFCNLFLSSGVTYVTLYFYPCFGVCLLCRDLECQPYKVRWLILISYLRGLDDIPAVTSLTTHTRLSHKNHHVIVHLL